MASRFDPNERVATWLIAVGLTVRVAAACALAFGPWTNEADELAGWDITRFWNIASEPGRAWVDHAVEYPPGSVVLIEAVTVPDLVTSHRILIAASLLVELALVFGLVRWMGRTSAAAFLVLSLPLVPGELLRFDLWAAGLALAGLAALDNRARASGAGVGALAIVIGAAVKVMPIVIAPIAIGRRRWDVVGATAVLGGVALAAWLAYGGLDAPSQVLSLRDATGWHVESVPGAINTLVAGEPARFEADVYRVGTIDPGIVWLGRGLFAAVAGGLIGLRLRATALDGHSSKPIGGEAVGPNDRSLDAAMAIALIAAMLVTAPLLSPQFLLWLMPFAAIVAATNGWRDPIVIVCGLASLLTGVTLAAFGPPGLDVASAAILLTGRNALLVALIPLGARYLMRRDPVPQVMPQHER